MDLHQNLAEDCRQRRRPAGLQDFVGHRLRADFRTFLGEAPVTAGWFAGFSTLAVVTAINDTDGSLYMALMGQYGSADDAAAIP